VAFALVFSGESLGITFCSLFYEPGFSVNITSLIFSIMITMSGLFSTTMPALFTKLNYASVMKYGVEVTLVSVLQDTSFHCSSDDIISGQCTLSDGQQLIDAYGFSVNDLVRNLYAIAIFIIVYRLIAFLVLKYKKVKYAQ